MVGVTSSIRIKLIFFVGLDPNAILKDNWSLLLLAASVGNPEMTKLLIERGADVNYDKGTYMQIFFTKIHVTLKI